MSFFDIDAEIPFEDYKRTIYHHAYSYYPVMTNPAQILRVAIKVFVQAKQDAAAGKWDMALYYALRTVALMDYEKTKTDLRKHCSDARSFMTEVMTFVEDILNKGNLLQHYNNLIANIRSNESDRKRIISLQMETDKNLNLTDDPNAHSKRRQQLLNNEQDALDTFRKGIFGVQTTTSAPFISRPISQEISPALLSVSNPPYTQNLQNTPITLQNTQTPLSIADQEFLPEDTGFLRLNKWNFNIGNVPKPFRRGIVNLGNTCYMNSILQMVNHTPLGDFFLKDDYKALLNRKDDIYAQVVHAFAFVMRELNRVESSFAVSASALKASIGKSYSAFDNSKQQDANEFLRVLLDCLHCGLNANFSNTIKFNEIDSCSGSDEVIARKFWWQYAQKNASSIIDLCAFQERSSVVCSACGLSSRSFPPTFGLELSIPTKQNICVEDCLTAYCAKELLGTDSLYFCPRCKEKVKATKQLQFFSVPKILFITLKRFRCHGDFSNLDKVNFDIVFQRTLDLKPFMCSSFSHTNFKLVGIVNHQGNIHGGHYTADVLGKDGFWCNCSDESITPSSSPNFKLAYVLCYVREE